MSVPPNYERESECCRWDTIHHRVTVEIQTNVIIENTVTIIPKPAVEVISKKIKLPNCSRSCASNIPAYSFHFGEERISAKEKLIYDLGSFFRPFQFLRTKEILVSYICDFVSTTVMSLDIHRRFKVGLTVL